MTCSFIPASRRIHYGHDFTFSAAFSSCRFNQPGLISKSQLMPHVKQIFIDPPCFAAFAVYRNQTETQQSRKPLGMFDKAVCSIGVDQPRSN